MTLKCSIEGHNHELFCNISNTRDSVSSGYPNTERRVENTTRTFTLVSGFILRLFLQGTHVNFCFENFGLVGQLYKLHKFSDVFSRPNVLTGFVP